MKCFVCAVEEERKATDAGSSNLIDYFDVKPVTTLDAAQLGFDEPFNAKTYSLVISGQSSGQVREATYLKHDCTWNNNGATICLFVHKSG